MYVEVQGGSDHACHFEIKSTMLLEGPRDEELTELEMTRTNTLGTTVAMPVAISHTIMVFISSSQCFC